MQRIIINLCYKEKGTRARWEILSHASFKTPNIQILNSKLYYSFLFVNTHLVLWFKIILLKYDSLVIFSPFRNVYHRDDPMLQKLGFFLLFSLFSAPLFSQEVQKEFYDDAKSQVKAEINLKDGKREGMCKTFHPNGKVKQEATFKDDKKSGVYIEYYESGNKKIECNYVNGFLSGIYKEFHDNGNLKLLTRYYKQIDDSKEAPVFVQKKANILTFTEYEYYDDGKTIRRKVPMSIYRTVKDSPNGRVIFDVMRSASGTEIFYFKDGKVEFEHEYLNDRKHVETVRFARVPAESSQLISDGGIVAEIADAETLPE